MLSERRDLQYSELSGPECQRILSCRMPRMLSVYVKHAIQAGDALFRLGSLKVENIFENVYMFKS